MRNALDLSPLFRSTVGFDRLFDMVEQTRRLEQPDGYPPYDIERLAGDRYRITLAVAGFEPDELSLIQHPNLLVVEGRKQGREGGQYLHRGIAARPFERRFELADWVRVAGANLDGGLLTVELVREVPEEMKPRRIEVQAGGAPLRLDGERQEDGGAEPDGTGRDAKKAGVKVA